MLYAATEHFFVMRMHEKNIHPVLPLSFFNRVLYIAVGWAVEIPVSKRQMNRSQSRAGRERLACAIHRSFDAIDTLEIDTAGTLRGIIEGNQVHFVCGVFGRNFGTPETQLQAVKPTIRRKHHGSYL